MIKELSGKIKQFAPEVLVHVGIGGSRLGTEAIYRALRSKYSPKMRVMFLSSNDSAQVRFLLEQVDLSRSVFVFVSKSFRTQETVSILQLVLKEYEKK